ncbi:hypothetical protein [Dubosiella newyorkensis]|uniref:hypothetical protein n=1 Tax=Dubosiella newyorkensis TaxID=1862672 RepID=UPI0023F40F72|nr:hypothetical protein [Dubosiella newyorkensis]
MNGKTSLQAYFDEIMIEALIRIFSQEHFEEEYFETKIDDISEEEWYEAVLAQVMALSSYPILRDLSKNEAVVSQPVDDFQNAFKVTKL